MAGLRRQHAAMFRLPAALKAKGLKAEAAFRDWLNRSGVAFLYVEQSPLNVPERLRRRIKRPDYLVGIPHAGMLAFDVKAKSAYDDHLLFDAGEVERLGAFEAAFHMTVHFACMELDDPDRFYWVPLWLLARRPVERRGKARVIMLEVAETVQVATAEGFLDAYARFSKRALDL